MQGELVLTNRCCYFHRGSMSSKLKLEQEKNRKVQGQLALENHVPPAKHKNVSTVTEDAKYKVNLHLHFSVDISAELWTKNQVRT